MAEDSSKFKIEKENWETNSTINASESVIKGALWMDWWELHHSCHFLFLFLSVYHTKY